MMMRLQAGRRSKRTRAALSLFDARGQRRLMMSRSAALDTWVGHTNNPTPAFCVQAHRTGVVGDRGAVLGECREVYDDDAEGIIQPGQGSKHPYHPNCDASNQLCLRASRRGSIDRGPDESELMTQTPPNDRPTHSITGQGGAAVRGGATDTHFRTHDDGASQASASLHARGRSPGLLNRADAAADVPAWSGDREPSRHIGGCRPPGPGARPGCCCCSCC